MLARSGIELEVAEDMTILQALENSKAAKVECLCREGICGTCETRIVEGKPITAISISVTKSARRSKLC